MKRRGRVLLAAVAGVVLLGTVAGCGGDLSRSNFQRTTVPPEPAGSGGTGPVASGPINDPAVTPGALRFVDPCALLSAENLSSIGTGGEPTVSGWDECSAKVTDAGRKDVRFRLEFGSSVIGSVDEARTSVEGLPQLERKQDEETCNVMALTSRDPKVAISLQVTYAGGDACGAGRTVLQRVVKGLHSSPKKHTVKNGSLIGVDPCTAVDPAMLTEVLGGKVESALPLNLHGCVLRSRTPDVTINFRTSMAPSKDEDNKEVDLGGGLKGFAEARDANEPRCQITWAHLQVGDPKDLDSAEVVDVSFNGGTGSGTGQQACDTALKVAKNLAGKLPKS